MSNKDSIKECEMIYCAQTRGREEQGESVFSERVFSESVFSESVQ